MLHLGKISENVPPPENKSRYVFKRSEPKKTVDREIITQQTPAKPESVNVTPSAAAVRQPVPVPAITPVQPLEPKKISISNMSQSPPPLEPSYKAIAKQKSPEPVHKAENVCTPTVTGGAERGKYNTLESTQIESKILSLDQKIQQALARSKQTFKHLDASFAA
jgi:hypothetical protein